MATSTSRGTSAPTLTAYLAREARTASPRSPTPTGWRRRPAIAQAFHHSILPLAPMHDRRTEIRWGLRDFELRFGRRRRRCGCRRRPWTWSPCGSCRGSRRRGDDPRAVAGGRAARRHPPPVPRGPGRRPAITVAFYDADLSGAVSFEPAAPRTRTASHASASRPRLAAPMPGGATAALVDRHATASCTAITSRSATCSCTASSTPETGVPDRGFDVVGPGGGVAEPGGPLAPRDPDPRADVVELPPRGAALVRRVPGRARRALEGPPARRARAPGRRDRRGDRAACPGAPRPGRPVGGTRRLRRTSSSGAVEPEAFAAAAAGPRGRGPARQRLLDLLEAQRWRLAMFASDGWFWDDPMPARDPPGAPRGRARGPPRGRAGGTARLEARLVDDLSALRRPRSGSTGRRSTASPERGRASHRPTPDPGAARTDPGIRRPPGEPGAVGGDVGRRKEGGVGDSVGGGERSGEADRVRPSGARSVEPVAGVDAELEGADPEDRGKGRGMEEQFHRRSTRISWSVLRVRVDIVN